MHHFAVALRDAGHPVREAWLANTDHTSVYSAGVAAPVVVNWLHHTWPETAAARG
jgi:hypothetical protein